MKPSKFLNGAKAMESEFEALKINKT